MEFKLVNIEKPADINFILGQSHFIKTVEDLHETLVSSVPDIKFGIAFCEASGPKLVRISGNDKTLIELAKSNAMNIGAGHSFIIFMQNAYPINILPAIKSIPEICTIFCATANPVQVIIAETPQGHAIIGVVDGESPAGVEDEQATQTRKQFLRNIGYKL